MKCFTIEQDTGRYKLLKETNLNNNVNVDIIGNNKSIDINKTIDYLSPTNKNSTTNINNISNNNINNNDKKNNCIISFYE